jgi:ABC-2 type transport system ATP-binding protein
MMPVLSARGLGKRYGSRWALRDCTLEVPAGAVVALVGPNGAGKSTLLQLAAGLLAPSEGSVSVFGQAPCDRADLLGRVGFVAQDAPLYPTFRVEEMLEFGRRLNLAWDDAWPRELCASSASRRTAASARSPAASAPRSR